MTLSKQLHHLQATYSQADALGKREREGLTALKTLNVFWSGASEASMEVSIQDLIRSAAQQSGGTVISSSAMTANATSTPNRLIVRARIDGSLATLIHLLAVVDAQHPKLFVSNLAVSSVRPGTQDQPSQLSFELSVWGYVEGALYAN
jgi:hypothetical protein